MKLSAIVHIMTTTEAVDEFSVTVRQLGLYAAVLILLIILILLSNFACWLFVMSPKFKVSQSQQNYNTISASYTIITKQYGKQTSTKRTIQWHTIKKLYSSVSNHQICWHCSKHVIKLVLFHILQNK